MVIEVEFQEKDATIEVDVSENSVSLDLEIDYYYTKEHSFYDGSYDITPSIGQQLLQTKDTIMTDDVIISAVPYYEVQNDSEGLTVYIASEVN